jgi:hypothetical protein
MGSATPTGTSTKEYLSGHPIDSVSQTPRSSPSTLVSTRLTSTSSSLAPNATPTRTIRRIRWFQHHDSTFSVTDDYEYPSSNDLNIWNGAALLCADCLGTGLLALPYDITVVLGSAWGLFFLILQLPINLYAGSILSHAALFVETKEVTVNDINNNNNNNITSNVTCVPQQPTHTTTTAATITSAIIPPNKNTASVHNYQAVSINVDKDMDDENSLVDVKNDDNRHCQLHRELE